MDSLGDRMKRYERVTKNVLVNRTPVIIRLDGVHFHTFTKGFVKPFDMVLVKAMQDTMRYLCKNIQNCVLGYTQSDEITLVLCDYKTLKTSAWFDNEVQKLCSVSASMTTYAFNKYFAGRVNEYGESLREHVKDENYLDLVKLQTNYQCAIMKGAYFDARSFNIPIEEVTNCILWRQQDATRNSIQSLAQANFSQIEMFGLSCNKLQDKLFLEKNINWNNLPTTLKRGSCCVKDDTGYWVIDEEIPIFRGEEGRSYIENRIIF